MRGGWIYIWLEIEILCEGWMENSLHNSLKRTWRWSLFLGHSTLEGFLL